MRTIPIIAHTVTIATPRTAGVREGRKPVSDGSSAPFNFQRLTLRRGYGAGTSVGSALSFTYGLSAEDSAPYLKLPAGQELRRDGSSLELVTAVPFPR